jgi:endo-1,4-beta-mannosidase
MPTRKGDPRQRRQSRFRRAAEAEQRLLADEQAPGDGATAGQHESDRTEAEERPAAPSAPRRNARFPLGVNYYPLDSETQSAENAYSGDVADDFATFAEARFALVRVFLSWKAIEPQVAQYDDDAIERIADVFEAARENKIQALVCFFADDRSGELVDVPWGKRRDARTDGYLVQREVAFVQNIVTRFRAEPAIFAWDLANEAFCAGFSRSSEMLEWARTMRDAIREVDDTRPVTIGIDPETLFRETGVDARATVELMEFGVSHLTSEYRAYAAEGPITSGPSTYLPSFLLHASRRDLPVLLDDAGATSLDTSVAEEAAYLRMALWSGLMNRAAGVLARRYRDLETERREPYFIDPFESLVGVADSEGEPKPSFEEMRRFARLAARIDLGHYEATPERAAILVPDERYEPLPNLAGLYDARACLHGFIGMKEAHIPVSVAHESDDFRGWQMLVVPSAFRLAEDTWERLATFVQSGGSLVLSYGGGEMPAAVRDVFGVEFLGDGGPRETFSCRVAQAGLLGEIASFDVPFSLPNVALLSAGDATIVATDERGGPLLTYHQVGQGRAVFVAVPIERAVAQNDPWATPAPVSTILRSVYAAVGRSAGCASPVYCDSPDVEIAVLQGEDDDVVLLLNHAPDPVTATLSCDRRVASIADVRGGAPVPIGVNGFTVPLEANGTSALRLSYA